MDACKLFALPEPTIEPLNGGVLVTLIKATDFSIKKQIASLNERQIKAVQYVKENHKISNKEYQLINSISRETASRDLKILIDLEVFTNSGVKGAGAVYFLK